MILGLVLEPERRCGIIARHEQCYRRFHGGRLNTCYNALDLHVENGRGDQTALIYDSPVTDTVTERSFRELRDEAGVFAGALASLGVTRGDRVVVYRPMVPEAVVAMLACARLGAVHSVVFGGFAAAELAVRIDDATTYSAPGPGVQSPHRRSRAQNIRRPWSFTLAAAGGRVAPRPGPPSWANFSVHPVKTTPPPGVLPLFEPPSMLFLMESVTPDLTRARFEPDLAAGRRGLSQLWRRQGLWQIKMRWAVAPLMVAGIVAGRLLGFEFPLLPFALIALANLVYNTLFAVVFGRYRDRLRVDPKLDRIFTFTEAMVDYAAMFLLIYFSGGASSPLIVFLIFHVILTAIQFAPKTAYSLAGVAAGGLWILLWGETRGFLRCHHITYHGTSLHLDGAASSVVTLGFFTAALFITAALVSRIVERLRERVGDLAEATSDLAKAYEAVEALMRERTEFMLEVAHNLRAPLTASLSMADLLKAEYLGGLTEPQKNHLERLEARLQALSLTIGELLAIARTRDRSREIEDVVADIDALAHHTEETFAHQAAGKGIAFRVVRDGRLPHLASGRGLLEQLMENLVSNAIKYTPEGGDVEVRFEHDGHDAVRIVVKDSGIGIPGCEQSKLFREFFRATNARKLTPLGTGLGLVLVQQTVERHGGTLNMTSAEGAGTTVVVRLPTC